jgi:4-diphosphocytidyl-2-C-methyl-D-erythritol kinase
VTPTKLTLRSFAKINWSLQILGKRPDGYHNLRTILQTVSLHDDLHFELIDEDSITASCDDPRIPSDAGNLVVRSAAALKSSFNVSKGVRIRLEKRIPSKAGLGGGSSNAAVTLLALSHLWQIQATNRELLTIASELGADVPFFLLGGAALAEGTGTNLSPLPDYEKKFLIIVSPNAEISTVDAYNAYDRVALTTPDRAPILSSSPNDADADVLVSDAAISCRHNDFESVVFDISPEIKRAKQAILRTGADEALMAGSGSSVFGIFSDLQAQQKAITGIQLEPGWRVYPCVTLSRNEYDSALNVGSVSLVRSFNSESNLGA